MTQGAAVLLMFVVLPVWLLAGLADYLCHRATNIETTSGVRESMLHLVQFGLVGIPVTLALFFRANAGFFLLAAFFLLLHHIVAAIDLGYANPKRYIAPREQMIHNALEMLPITAFFLLAVIYWPQFTALFHVGPERLQFAPQLRPLPLLYIVTLISSALLFNLLP
jgi:hypothetical protein